MSDNNNDILHVEGGKPLNGTIKVRGAKNFVSKAMVAALLAPGQFFFFTHKTVLL